MQTKTDSDAVLFFISLMRVKRCRKSLLLILRRFAAKSPSLCFSFSKGLGDFLLCPKQKSFVIVRCCNACCQVNYVGQQYACFAQVQCGRPYNGVYDKYVCRICAYKEYERVHFSQTACQSFQRH